MGLDMTLSKKVYVKNWDHTQPNQLTKISVKRNDEDIKELDISKISYIEQEVGYWRKANQIHNWFVQNVQNGVDNCGEYYVSPKKLRELLDLCNQVKADHKLARKLLPPAQGFFFGSNEIDEYYFEDIDLTIDILNEAIEDKESSFVYSSSW